MGSSLLRDVVWDGRAVNLRPSDLHRHHRHLILVISPRHTTLRTTLDDGLGVGWGDCIAVRHLSDSFSCYDSLPFFFLRAIK